MCTLRLSKSSFLDLMDPEISKFYIILKCWLILQVFPLPFEDFDLFLENKNLHSSAHFILKHFANWYSKDEPDCFSHGLLHIIQKVQFWAPAFLRTLNWIWENSVVHISCKKKLPMGVWGCNSLSVSTIWSSICSKSHDGGLVFDTINSPIFK